MTVPPRLRTSRHARVEPAGILPRRALRFLRGKRLRTSEHWTDVWREEHATAFTAARLTQESLVEEVHRGLVQALREGETMETFRARLQPWLEAKGWRPPLRGGDVPTRLARIYRTNMRTARAAGQWERILRSSGTLPYLVYSLGPSLEHRKQHVAWDGLILPVDSPWWNTHAPPNGWGCKCRIRPVTRRERERMLRRDPDRYSTSEPPVRTRTWVNPVTRKTHRVPEGIDPGWDYNPGAHRTLGVHRALVERSESMLAGRALPDTRAPVREAIVRGRIQAFLAGPGFRWFAERPRASKPPRWDSTAGAEAVPVAVLTERAPAPLRATSKLVRLKEPLMDKQWRHHGGGRTGKWAPPEYEIPIEWYAAIQRMLDTITPWEQPVKDRRTGRESVRWVYEDQPGTDPDEVRRLVVGIDEDDGVPIVFTLHRR